MSARFVLYELLDPRGPTLAADQPCPRTDPAVFYVGKTITDRIGRRLTDHIRAALSYEENELRGSRIRAILAAGCRPRIQVVLDFESQSEAFEAERERIATYPPGQLTNLDPGGSGGWRTGGEAAPRPEQQAALRSELENWVRLYGGLPGPTSVANGRPLRARLRRSFVRRTLAPQTIERLRELGADDLWLNPHEASWAADFTTTYVFSQAVGRSPREREMVEGRPIGRWLTRQRRAAQQGRLTAWRRAVLIGAGLIADPQLGPNQPIAISPHLTGLIVSGHLTPKQRPISRAKLTETNVRVIRERYAAGGVGQSDLAREFGISRAQVWNIVKNKSWRHLAAAA
jgi:hypothetical protein